MMGDAMSYYDHEAIKNEIRAGTHWSEMSSDQALSPEELGQAVDLECGLRNDWSSAWEREDVGPEVLFDHPSFTNLRRIYADELLRSKHYTHGEVLVISKWVEAYTYRALSRG